MAPFIQFRPEILRNARDFARNWDQIVSLLRRLGQQDDVLLDPLHFLAATDEIRRSCSIACWDGTKLVGLTYLTEHYAHGIRTGYAIGGDYTGRGLLLCRREDQAAVIQASLREATRIGLHSIHLWLSTGPALGLDGPGLRMRQFDAEIPGDRMALPHTFEAFLGTLGKHTRRNVRYYTRKAHAAGIEFAPSLGREEYQAALQRLNLRGPFQADASHVARDERLLALHSGGERLGLRAADGALVSILCGFVRRSRFHLLTQVNDKNYESFSLSMVLRGGLVEHLIARGIAELQFMGGTSLSFGRFCTPMLYRSIFVDKRMGVRAAAKQISAKVAQKIAAAGRPIPELLKMLCNGYLEESELVKRTALGAAAVAFPRKHSAPHTGVCASGIEIASEPSSPYSTALALTAHESQAVSSLSHRETGARSQFCRDGRLGACVELPIPSNDETRRP